MEVGNEAWPNVMGGWACPSCKNSTAPTWAGVLKKAGLRISKGVPIGLTLADYGALSAMLRETTNLVATRRGGQGVWSEFRNRAFDIALLSDWQLPDVNDAYGLVEDAIEHRFNPNLSTAQFLQLGRAIEDPNSTDLAWEMIFQVRDGIAKGE